MNKQVFALLVAGSALAAAAVPAVAQWATATPQHRSYPGAACLPYNGGVDGQRDVDGSIRNATTGWQDYICPLRIDEVYDGDMLLKTKMWVVEDTSAASLTCHIHSYGKNRLPEGWGMASTSKAGFSLATQPLELGTILVPEDGHAVLRCSVPPMQGGGISRIVSYHAGR